MNLNPFKKSAGAAAADAAPGSKVCDDDLDPNAPHSRPAEALSEGEKHDQLTKNAEDRQEALVDEGIEETFPASDPVSAKHIT
jgi:hypothetical protein